MCSKSHLHPGFIVKGHGKLHAEVDGLLDRVSATELQQLVTKAFSIAIRQTPLPTLSHGKKNLKVILFAFFIQWVEFALDLGTSSRWWLCHLCHLDFKINQFIFLVQHLNIIVSEDKTAWNWLHLLFKRYLWRVINWTEFLFVTKGDVEILSLLLLDHKDLALEYFPVKLWLWNRPVISVPQKFLLG